MTDTWANIDRIFALNAELEAMELKQVQLRRKKRLLTFGLGAGVLAIAFLSGYLGAIIIF